METESGMSDISDKIREKFDPLKDPITNIRTSKSGKTIVICKDPAAVDEIKKKLSNDLGNTCSISEPKVKERIVKIVGSFNQELDEDEIINRIKKQNDYIGVNASLEIIKITKRSKYVVILLKADEDSFRKLIENGKCKILWSNCNVYQHISPIYCYKCNRYDHMIENCLSTTDICGKCSEKHKTADCTSKSVCCINCIEANTAFNKNELIDHPAWSFKCPIMKRKWSQRQKRTFYDNK